MGARSTNLLKGFTILGLALLISMAMAEAVLRLAFHIRPGEYWDSQWIHAVDTLKVLRGYYADEQGIFKIAPEVRQRADSILKNRVARRDFNSPLPIPPNYEGGLAYLPQENLDVFSGKSKSDLAKRLRSILQNKPQNCFDTLLLDYLYHPVNKHGFRSIAFSPLPTDQTRVMLLGDSYTWGQSAEDLTRCFADQLLADGFAVYNFGIPGADPAQYLAIAKTYIPIIKPDVIIVNVYGGNDIFYYHREPQPGVPLFYFTNAGCILNQPLHRYFNSPEIALDFALKTTFIPKRTWFDKCCSLSSIGTLLWKFCAKMEWVNIASLEYEEYHREAASVKLKEPAVNREYQAIQNLAKQTGALCLVSFIPEVKMMTGLTSPDNYKGLNLGPDLLIEQKLELADYNIPQQHFNDAGHQKYAHFLRKELEKRKKSPNKNK
ncbi:MAG: SGNH/GDSL hydrolase family protein [Bacteroidia bacterium]|nr:SGNH/GDSL hydrolase family protein [Bacteroidia bacterium]